MYLPNLISTDLPGVRCTHGNLSETNKGSAEFLAGGGGQGGEVSLYTCVVTVCVLFELGIRSLSVT